MRTKDEVMATLIQLTREFTRVHQEIRLLEDDLVRIDTRRGELTDELMGIRAREASLMRDLEDMGVSMQEVVRTFKINEAQLA